ncbi:hypothetical protein SLEP1_g30351 [Rubroshorea leprosula]|uniref:Uncharacterized protein n=1 Tax=Rubroshorea leprosula TaxID=152421 RepID=A0AAV5K8F5_9ROSI|nr:hypothetical protein SLEP1_g30351 [Rubroshorea leprosula]
MKIWILLGPAHLLTRSWGKLKENTDVRAHQMKIWILLGPAHLLTRSWGKLMENTNVRAHQMEIWILLDPAHLLTRSWGKLKENTDVRAHQMKIWILLSPTHLLTRSWGKLMENTNVKAHQMKIWILLGPAHLLMRSWGKLKENTDVRAHQMKIWILLGPAHLLTRSWGKLMKTLISPNEDLDLARPYSSVDEVLGQAQVIHALVLQTLMSTLGGIFASLQLVLEQVACSSCSKSFSLTSGRMLAAQQIMLEFIMLLSLTARAGVLHHAFELGNSSSCLSSLVLVLELCIMPLSLTARVGALHHAFELGSLSMDFCTSRSCLSRSAFFPISSSLCLDELSSLFNFPLPLGLVSTTKLLRAGEFRVATIAVGCASLFNRGIEGSSGIRWARILPIAISRTLVLSSSSVVRAGSVDLSGHSCCEVPSLGCLCLVPVGIGNCSDWVAYPIDVLSSSSVLLSCSCSAPPTKRFLDIVLKSFKPNSNSCMSSCSSISFLGG